MDKQMKYSSKVRERAVCLVYENQGDYGSQWAAIVSIAPNEDRLHTRDSAYLGAPVRNQPGYSKRNVKYGP